MMSNHPVGGHWLEKEKPGCFNLRERERHYHYCKGCATICHTPILVLISAVFGFKVDNFVNHYSVW